MPYSSFNSPNPTSKEETIQVLAEHFVATAIQRLLSHLNSNTVAVLANRLDVLPELLDEPHYAPPLEDALEEMTGHITEMISVVADDLATAYLRDQPYLDDSMSDLERERARGRAAEASQ